MSLNLNIFGSTQPIHSFLVNPQKVPSGGSTYQYEKRTQNVDDITLRQDYNFDHWVTYRMASGQVSSLMIDRHSYQFIQAAQQQKLLDTVTIGVTLSNDPQMPHKLHLECLLKNGDHHILAMRNLHQHEIRNYAQALNSNRLCWKRQHLKYGGKDWIVDHFSDALSLAHNLGASATPKPVWVGKKLSQIKSYTESLVKRLLRKQQKASSPKRRKGPRPTL